MKKVIIALTPVLGLLTLATGCQRIKNKGEIKIGREILLPLDSAPV